MYYLSNYCSLCLARSENITSLINIELNAQQILDNIIPDYSTNELIPNTEIHIPKQICDICLNSLNNIFKFKQRCLDSIATFTEYVHRLVRDYGPNNFQSVTVDDIPHFKKEENIENFDFDTTESIPNLKSEICETDDGNNVQMETQNEPTSTNFESIEMVSIKVEAPENEFYEEGAIHEETMVKEDDSLETDMPPEDLTEPGNSASVEPTNNTDMEEDQEEEKETDFNTKKFILPQKSKELYEEAYNTYKKWCVKMNIKKTTEDSILEYFSNSMATYKSSTLWTKYSMLRSTISLRENIDISKFPSIIPFLRKKAHGYKPKKSMMLTKENIDRFLIEADNREHLLNKVILIFGIIGACRRQELASLVTTNVQDFQTHFLVKLLDTKTNSDRSFIILPGQIKNVNLLDIIRSYVALRSPKTHHNRFFVNFIREKCTVQPVGVHKIASVPAVVAKFNNLENYTLYTGHCFRRTPSTLLQ